MRVCIVGASGKLGRYMVQHALDRGYEVVGVCRPRSVRKLDPFHGRMTVVPGATCDGAVIRQALAVIDFAQPGARLVFSCGWHITRDGQDVYTKSLKRQEAIARWAGRLTGL